MLNHTYINQETSNKHLNTKNNENTNHANLYPNVCLGQEKVTKEGFESVVKMEQIVTGHLTELNGKYKLRVTETTYAPGGFIGEHHHVGPGIRYVLSGQLTYVQTDTTRIFNTGDYFYE